MKSKFICRLTSAFLVLSLMISAGVITVSANNHQDTGFTYSFSYIGQQDRTDYRDKTDATSSYMNCTGGAGRYTAWVVGKNKFGSEVNMSGGSYYGFASGQSHYMSNYVYENYGGQSNCVAAIRGESLDGNTAFGVWSPDSV